MTDRKMIWEQLERAEIGRGDTVMVHSSLKRIGETEGRAEGLIDAMRDYLSEGLLLFPTLTWKYVNRNSPVYDARTTVPCVGALSSVAAFYAGGVRSTHPTDSMVAFGKRAEAYVAGEEKMRTPTPADGCWGRLYEERAKLLLAGVGLDRNTYIHSVEERANVPDRLSEDEVPFVSFDRFGGRHEQPCRINFSKATPDVSVYFPKFASVLEQNGAIHKAKLGMADTIVCDAVRMTDILVALYEKAKQKQVDLCVDERSLEELLH